MTDHVKIAAALIERMKTVRPTCPKCETLSFDSAIKMQLDGAEPEAFRGFYVAPSYAGFVRRCDACTNRLEFPWADKLDTDRVAKFIEADPRCAHAFALEILKETLATVP